MHLHHWQTGWMAPLEMTVAEWTAGKRQPSYAG